MPELPLDDASVYIGIKRSQLEKIIKYGEELHRHRLGRKFVVDQDEIDAWQARKLARSVLIDRADFLRAFKFALEVNYFGHTRSDFGSARQRSTTQAVENWTQGALAEIALQKFIHSISNVRIELEFRIFQDQIVGQDIVAVIKERVSNPPRKGVSVKSGKENGMFLIVPIPEVERAQRVSDYYVFVRMIYADDFILRLFRDHPDLASVRERIPEFHDFRAEIVGYCSMGELEKVEEVVSAGIEQPKYVKATGKLKNTDADWRLFVESL